MVTNAYGAATSQVATLTVSPPLIREITQFSIGSSGNISLSCTGAPGQAYILLTASNLVSPITWTPSTTNYADTNGVFSYSDFLATNAPQRFYRLLAP